MNEDFDHGPRLSGEEYDRAITTLQEERSPEPSRAEMLALDRAEFDLAVDYRLGRDFSRERRDALWAVHRKLRRRPLWTMLKYALRGIVTFDRAREGKKLARSVVDAYGDVLTRAELESFLGVEEVSHPALPVDEEPG